MMAQVIYSSSTLSTRSDALRIDYNVNGWTTHEFNKTSYVDGVGMEFAPIGHWSALLLIPVIISGIAGNLLVCVAVRVEKRLQNDTNLFLVSLAVADLLVSCVVMPCCTVQEFIGYWPFGFVLCDAWQTCDVMLCTSSIMHMCTISIDRYIGIRNPMLIRSRSSSMMGVKIGAVWLISLAIASPVVLLGVLRPQDVMSEYLLICAIANRPFFIYGSMAAFFIPLLIMLVAYTLSIHVLSSQSLRLGQSVSNTDTSNNTQDHHMGMRRSRTVKKKDRHGRGRSEQRSVITKLAPSLHMINGLKADGKREECEEDNETETNSKDKVIKRNSARNSITLKEFLSYNNRHKEHSNKHDLDSSNAVLVESENKADSFNIHNHTSFLHRRNSSIKFNDNEDFSCPQLHNDNHNKFIKVIPLANNYTSHDNEIWIRRSDANKSNRESLVNKSLQNDKETSLMQDLHREQEEEMASKPDRNNSSLHSSGDCSLRKKGRKLKSRNNIYNNCDRADYDQIKDNSVSSPSEAENFLHISTQSKNCNDSARNKNIVSSNFCELNNKGICSEVNQINVSRCLLGNINDEYRRSSGIFHNNLMNLSKCDCRELNKSENYCDPCESNLQTSKKKRTKSLCDYSHNFYVHSEITVRDAHSTPNGHLEDNDCKRQHDFNQAFDNENLESAADDTDENCDENPWRRRSEEKYISVDENCLESYSIQTTEDTFNTSEPCFPLLKDYLSKLATVSAIKKYDQPNRDSQDVSFPLTETITNRIFNSGGNIKHNSSDQCKINLGFLMSPSESVSTEYSTSGVAITTPISEVTLLSPYLDKPELCDDSQLSKTDERENHDNSVAGESQSNKIKSVSQLISRLRFTSQQTPDNHNDDNDETSSTNQTTEPFRENSDRLSQVLEFNSSRRESISEAASSNKSKKGPDRFKTLVQKHSATIRVAGMLLVRRENNKMSAIQTVQTEKKAVKVLGTMFTIFVVCWAPFFTANLMNGLCGDRCNIDALIFRAFLWLGYLSSTVNPLVYTVFNKTFRRTFYDLILCKRSCRPSHPSNRTTPNLLS